MNIEEKLVQTITGIVVEKYDITPEDGMIMVEIPKDNSNGDYSTNIAMRLTKILRRRPQEIAQEIKEELLKRLDNVQSIDIAGPGFINF
ncbi:MAG: arginine--tRNA ligase, partial [Erysipelotrichaceae bacterium]|nr:arginine--tRNA ligase [Erysipelotrichaceae bacterium]